MTTINFDFTGITAGQELNVFEPLFAKLASSGANTIVGGSTAGTLSYVGTNSVPPTYAYETSLAEHSFKVTYAATGLSGSMFTCCARIQDFRNMLWLRFGATTTLEFGTLTNATPTLVDSWTVTRGANDEIELIVEASDQIRVKFNGSYLTFPSTGTTTKTITNFAGATKVGFCARASAVANVITAATVTHASPTSVVNINGGTNTVQIGSSGNTSATTGLTTATNASIDGAAMTSVAGSSSPWTFTCPPLTDEAVSPYPSGTFSITGAEGSPTLAGVDVTLPDGLVAIELAGTLNTTETGVLHDFSPAAVVTDEIFYPPNPSGSTYIIVDAQGNIDTNHSGTVEFWHWEEATGITRSYDVILGSGGVVTGGGLTSSGLTSIGLTRVGLTSSGL